jgi:phosphatidylglycerol:prolipoprotein diacylglycerol transferase
MQQVLFRIFGVPIYGFGMMLFLSFVVSRWLAGRRAEREGVAKDRLLDLALPIFAGGIIGARIVFMIQYGVPMRDWYKFWEGGIVFYGSALGGWIGYGLAWWIAFRKYHIATWKLADIVAPSVCVGLMIGRLGCFLNGCCYGHVCTERDAMCPKYPLITAPAKELVVQNEGYQTVAGFGLDEKLDAATMGQGPPIVGAVEAGSAAAKAGLQVGDSIVTANGVGIDSRTKLEHVFGSWPRGDTKLALSVVRLGNPTPIDLPEFKPLSLPLHPTQIYESISMGLLFFLLMAFFPFRRHYGQVFVLLMVGYAFHRFFNETLRNDTTPVLWKLTLSQVGSIAVLLAAIGLEIYLTRYSAKIPVGPPPAPEPTKASA